MRAMSPSWKRSVGPGIPPFTVRDDTGFIPAGAHGSWAIVRSYSTTLAPATAQETAKMRNAGRWLLKIMQEKSGEKMF